MRMSDEPPPRLAALTLAIHPFASEEDCPVDTSRHNVTPTQIRVLVKRTKKGYNVF
jgi:hypothetical protein